VGVPHDSFDAWYFRDLFLSGFSVGAPPDTFFRKGQKWGFPPVHPERARADGYRYFIDTLRSHLEYAGMLRLDHIMGLHRLYWIPEGFDADQGAYILNRAKELYAILVLEAHRSGATFIGEDLGTVPRAVRAVMKRRGVGRMYVLQSELRADPSRAAGTVESDCLASLNTHDMPPFAAFWRDEDTRLLQSLGHLDEQAAGKIAAERGDHRNALMTYLEDEGRLKKGDLEISAITDASHRLLAASDASMVMVNLEDLWQEERPQNVPGTTHENPNWRRKSAYSLEDIKRSKGVGARLRELDLLRKGGNRIR
jgi:4-alpha-glucanotransferase